VDTIHNFRPYGDVRGKSLYRLYCDMLEKCDLTMHSFKSRCLVAMYPVMTWTVSVASATAEIRIWAVYFRHPAISKTFQRCNEILKVPKMHQLVILILLQEWIKNINFKMVYTCLYAYCKTVIQISNTEYKLYEIMWIKKTKLAKNVFSCFAVITKWKIFLAFILNGLVLNLPYILHRLEARFISQEHSCL